MKNGGEHIAGRALATELTREDLAHVAGGNPVYTGSITLCPGGWGEPDYECDSDDDTCFFDGEGGHCKQAPGSVIPIN